ncbi:MAG: glutamyl-tRNA reductase [Clostridiaceae bacterium]|nr:glutamyl-tRNA reductase [Clostridiaceae bacterium]
MSIQLLSISHRTAPAEIRGLFSFAETEAVQLLHRLTGCGEIAQAVLLSTCNRTELYCSGADSALVWEQMQEILFEAAGAEKLPGLSDYMLRYQGKRAVHHLFMVTAGLDSVVLGEDQILGQVKQAFFLAQREGCCQSGFQTLFRMAVTAAKKVKTDTMLSKTSVSTASLALKQACQGFGSLQGKKLLLMGASGKIGSIVLKDALDIAGLEIFATVRQRLPRDLSRKQLERIIVIPYEKRYEYLDQMDLVISATSSPHYTVTGDHFRESCTPGRKRIFFDLAIPFDLEKDIGREPGVTLYSMEDMERLAKQNNALKKSCIPDARMILAEYEDAFWKERLYSQNRELVTEVKECICQKSGSFEAAWKRFFFGLKDVADAEEFETLLALMKKWKEKEQA